MKHSFLIIRIVSRSGPIFAMCSNKVKHVHTSQRISNLILSLEVGISNKHLLHLNYSRQQQNLSIKVSSTNTIKVRVRIWSQFRILLSAKYSLTRQLKKPKKMLSHVCWALAAYFVIKTSTATIGWETTSRNSIYKILNVTTADKFFSTNETWFDTTTAMLADKTSLAQSLKSLKIIEKILSEFWSTPHILQS